MIKLYELWPKRRLFWDKLRVHTLFCILSKSKEYIDIFWIVQNSTIPSYLTNYVKHFKFSCYLSLNARFSEKNNLFFLKFPHKASSVDTKADNFPGKVYGLLDDFKSLRKRAPKKFRKQIIINEIWLKKRAISNYFFLH